MKKFIIIYARKSILLFSIVGIMLTMLSGCSFQEKTVGNYRFYKAKLMESKLISSNAEYELYWDDEAKSVLLKSLITGKIWSDILYNAYKNGNSNSNVTSPISITVMNNTTLKTNSINSTDAINNDGSVLCKNIPNGIRITYFFNAYKIAIPVEYVLKDDSLSVSVDGSTILEDGTQYKLISVKLTPHLCSISNNKESYLFIPTGSGALMFTDERTSGSRKYSTEVYGSDASRRVPEDFTDNESTRLPVFGVSDGSTGMFAIIENGAEGAFISANAGNSKLGYSSVGAEVYFRGYDTFRYGSYGMGNIILQRPNEEIVKQKYVVRYYPLQDEKANYNYMAQVYRNYLIKNNLLVKSEINASLYSFSLNGATVVKTSKLGIPTNKLVAMTDFKQALNLIKDIYSKTDIVPAVRLINYGDNGMNPGKIGGDKKYPQLFGDINDLKDLQSYIERQKGLFFIDSDIVRYSKSGNGFSLNSDCSLTAIKHKSEQYLVDPIRLQSDDFYRILSRKDLKQAANNTINKYKKYGTDGISFSTLGSEAYSDYKDKKYYLKGSIEKDVKEILAEAKGKGYNVAVSSANSYAACAADILFDISTDNGQYDVFDVRIPFYQMVFHSYKPMYSKSVNLETDSKKAIMLAAESGMGLDFSLISKYTYGSVDSEFHKLYSMVYEDNLPLIKETVLNSNFKNCYYAVSNSALIKYEIKGGLSISYFENGVIIYANHTKNKINSPIGEIEAYDFGMTRGGNIQ